jgi:hypothetical protein
MELLLERIARRPDYTIGKWSIDGSYLCDTLEDPDRGLHSRMSLEEIAKVKVAGQTAIPTGRYRVILTHSSRFGRILPLLENVKGFEGVRIHAGNTPGDTAGCILPGENKVRGQVVNSRKWEFAIHLKIREAIDRKENVWLTIK